MEISINQPVGFTEFGSRANNEDTLFPPNPDQVSTEQRWFLVCDGVGGSEKGEIASNLAADSFDFFFRQNPVEIVTESYIQQAIGYAEEQFKQYLKNNEQATGMATTVTLLYLHKEGATVAHIGDSRVYFIRDGKIKWRTDDHSYVNELVKSGLLTPADASRHPQRNVITRALQGDIKSVEASVQLINELQKGDYFFLCSDGVLERIGDELLEHTLASSGSNEEKIITLRQLSIDGQTRDNFTAYLIQIKQIDGGIEPSKWTNLPAYERPEDDGRILVVESASPEAVPVDSEPYRDEAAVPIPVEADSPPPAVANQSPNQPLASVQTPVASQKSGLIGQVILWAVAIAFLCLGGYFIWTTFLSKKHLPIEISTHSQSTHPLVSAAPSVAPAVSTITHSLTSTLSQALKSGASNDGQATEKQKKIITITSRLTGQGSVLGEVFIGKAQDGLYGLTKDKESWWVEPQFSQIVAVDSHYFLGKTTNREKRIIINNSGHALIVDEIRSMHCNRILIRKGDAYDYLDKNYQSLGSFRFSKAKDYDETKGCTAEVIQGGKAMRIDDSFREIAANTINNDTQN